MPNTFMLEPTKSRMRFLAAAGALIALGGLTSSVLARQGSGTRPTIVLVHGAFADSSSWDGVVHKLQADGYRVIAAANPLRGLKPDSTYVAGVVDAVKGPVVLVGHSYGGAVISNAATGKNNVKALVFVSAFAPDAGETLSELSSKFPGSTLNAALAPGQPLPGGGKDLYIQQDKFPAQFAADVPPSVARGMAATQRPLTEASFGDRSGPPAWKAIPSWFIYGSADKNIPPAAIAFMAKRAGSKKTIEIKGASHVVMTSHPAETARLISEAAAATTSE
jgi:pimeloyl-ACP methyl ester carboxylesterase